MEAGNIPTDIIIYAVIAGFLMVWLSRILGTRSGSERQRPNPFTVKPEAAAAGAPAQNQAAARPAPLANVPAAIDAALVQIALIDRGFDPARFLENAKDAFSIVVTAFADGDRATLKDLLAPDVYASFEAEIGRREKAGHKVMTEVHAVSDATVIAARVDGTRASVTLRIRADETYALSDATGKTLAGHPDRVVTMTDVWTFARDLKSSDPRWLVTETRDDVRETDGMTLPEAGKGA